MNTRRWIAVGCAAGLVTIILFTVLATLAFGAGLGPTPRFTVFVVVNILIGFASISILTTAAAVQGRPGHRRPARRGAATQAGRSPDQLAAVSPYCPHTERKRPSGQCLEGRFRR